MSATELLPVFESKLARLGIPNESIKVFGSINVNIHVTCQSRKTAERWVIALNQFCSKVTCVESVARNKENKGSLLCPSTHRIYLIGATV